MPWFSEWCGVGDGVCCCEIYVFDSPQLVASGNLGVKYGGVELYEMTEEVGI